MNVLVVFVFSESATLFTPSSLQTTDTSTTLAVVFENSSQQLEVCSVVVARPDRLMHV